MLTDDLHIHNVTTTSAGFESGQAGPLVRNLMAIRGLDLPRESPPTIFEFAREQKRFDHVITLCSQRTQENYQVLYDVINMVFRKSECTIHHWDVPDFMSIQSEGEERIKAAEKIISNIEDKIKKFTDSIT